MKISRLPILKKHTCHGLASLAIIAACSQSAGATSVFDSTWTEIAAEDQVGSGGFLVDPGVGGQLFDAEYLAYKLVGNILSIGLQSGFDLVDGKVSYGGRNYYAGDLALSFDDNATTYEYAFDFGLLTKDYNYHLVDADTTGSDGIDDAGLYAVTAWNNDIPFPTSSPFAMDAGSSVAGSNGATSAGASNYSYWRTVSFNISSIGNIAGLDVHWTMSCGNDEINGSAASVPEPSMILLFGTGLVGLAGIHRRKRSKN